MLQVRCTYHSNGSIYNWSVSVVLWRQRAPSSWSGSHWKNTRLQQSVLGTRSSDTVLERTKFFEGLPDHSWSANERRGREGGRGNAIQSILPELNTVARMIALAFFVLACVISLRGNICAQKIYVDSEIETLASFNNLSSSTTKRTCLIFSRIIARQMRRESAETRPDHQTNTLVIPQFDWRRTHFTGYETNTQQSDDSQKNQNTIQITLFDNSELLLTARPKYRTIQNSSERAGSFFTWMTSMLWTIKSTRWSLCERTISSNTECSWQRLQRSISKVRFSKVRSIATTTRYSDCSIESTRNMCPLFHPNRADSLRHNVPLTTEDYRGGITTCPLSTLLLEERQLTRDGSTQFSEVFQNLRRDTRHSSNSEIVSTQCAILSDGSVNRQDLSRKVSVLHRWFLSRLINGSPNRLSHCRWIQSWDKVFKKKKTDDAQDSDKSHESQLQKHDSVVRDVCNGQSYETSVVWTHTRIVRPSCCSLSLRS